TETKADPPIGAPPNDLWKTRMGSPWIRSDGQARLNGGPRATAGCPAPREPSRRDHAAVGRAAKGAPLQAGLDPPVVLPVLIAQQHAIEPFKVLVPAAGLFRCLPDELMSGNAPLLTPGGVVDGAHPLEVSYWPFERFEHFLPMESTFGDPMVETILAVKCSGRIGPIHMRQLLATIKQQRELIVSVNQVGYLVEA